MVGFHGDGGDETNNLQQRTEVPYFRGGLNCDTPGVFIVMMELLHKRPLHTAVKLSPRIRHHRRRRQKNQVVGALTSGFHKAESLASN